MISNDVLYNELLLVRNDLAVAIGKITAVETGLRDTVQHNGDHETRLRSLERFRYWVSALAGCTGTVAGIVVRLVNLR
jgi:hypothetical protein